MNDKLAKPIGPVLVYSEARTDLCAFCNAQLTYANYPMGAGRSAAGSPPNSSWYPYEDREEARPRRAAALHQLADQIIEQRCCLPRCTSFWQQTDMPGSGEMPGVDGQARESRF
jgi:hypothetical protein